MNSKPQTPLTLKTLTDILSDARVVETPVPDASDTVKAVSSDSRKAGAGVVFVALVGSHTDGHQFLQQAADAGTVALVVEESRLAKITLPENIPVLAVKNSYKALAEIAAALNGHPGNSLKLVGITGTNGKTTVTHLVEKMLGDWGKTTGLIGTLGMRTSSKSYDDKTTGGHTTPMATELQEILASMLEQATEYVVMEASSHALAQHRMHGCDFDVAVLTNVTQDHLDYHKTMDHYWQAKAELFKNLTAGKSAVINLDSDYAEAFINACPEHVNVLTYSLENPEADVRAENLTYSITGATLTAITPQGNAQIRLKIAGQFSVYNALAALATGLALGIPLATCVDSLKQVEGVRGRFEVVAEEPYVIVDYAHTPDGLKNILSAARVVTPEGGRLICVFGCGGDFR